MESRKIRGRWWNFLLTLGFTLAITATVSFFAELEEGTPEVVVWTVALGTGIACVGGVTAGAMLLRLVLRKSVSFLSFVENQTHIRAAGVVGFGLLMLGFVLQLMGTMIQYVFQNFAGV